MSEAFAQQQRELLERLKEQFTSFPFNHAPNFAGVNLSEQAQQRLQPEAHNDFPFSFPTPPPSKGEDDVKISSTSAKKSSQSNNSWSYEDQFKQVRQVSRIKLPFNYEVSINTIPLPPRLDSTLICLAGALKRFRADRVRCRVASFGDSQHVFRIPHASLKCLHLPLCDACLCEN